MLRSVPSPNLSQRGVIGQDQQAQIRFLEKPLHEVKAIVDSAMENPFFDLDAYERREVDPDASVSTSIGVQDNNGAPQELDFDSAAISLPDYGAEDGFGTARARDAKQTLGRWSDRPDYLNDVIDDARAVDADPRIELRKQLSANDLSPRMLKLCFGLIDCLSPAGYLELSNKSLGEILNASVKEVRRATAIVRRLNPPGIGSFDKLEFRATQLKRLGYRPRDVDRLISEIRSACENNESRQARNFGLSADLVASIRNHDLAPDPWPERSGEGSPTIYLLPDYRIVKLVDGELRVQLASDLPQRLVDRTRGAKIVKQARPSDRSDLRKELRSIIELEENIAFWRTQTLGVIEAAVNFQRQYLKRERETLLPLMQKDLASKLKVSESLVSRIAREKLLETDRGLLPVQDLFSRPVKVFDASRPVSKHDVMMHIRKMVLNEPIERVFYSDLEIAERLQERNVDLQRRAVSNLRDDLGIPDVKARRVAFEISEGVNE